ncbi:hypothetical protein ACIQZM_18160 [Peribacillus sp. NPDC097206]
MNKLHIISEKTVFLTGGAKGEQASAQRDQDCIQFGNILLVII